MLKVRCNICNEHVGVSISDNVNNYVCYECDKLLCELCKGNPNTTLFINADENPALKASADKYLQARGLA